MQIYRLDQKTRQKLKREYSKLRLMLKMYDTNLLPHERKALISSMHSIEKQLNLKQIRK